MSKPLTLRKPRRKRFIARDATQISDSDLVMVALVAAYALMLWSG